MHMFEQRMRKSKFSLKQELNSIYQNVLLLLQTACYTQPDTQHAKSCFEDELKLDNF